MKKGCGRMGGKVPDMSVSESKASGSEWLAA